MNFNNILFLDIETASQQQSYEQLADDWKELWDLKAGLLNRGRDETSSEELYNRAGIYAEFGKIICISCGCLQGAKDDRKLVIKSYCGDDEKKLLTDFAAMLQKWDVTAERFLCAHNGKEFDYPYICRRMTINEISLPSVLQIAGKKPWEMRHLDTMELWKFGDYKNFTSLKLLAKVFDIASPKDDIDGSMVNTVYWVEKNLQRIVKYCQKDVVTLTQVLLRFNGEPFVKPENVSIKNVEENQL